MFKSKQLQNLKMESEDTKGKTIKRQRSENWSEEERELLKDLIKTRVGILENKNTDTNSNQKKKKAWLEVERDFNSLSSGGKRTLVQLKSQWTALKIQAKKEVSQFLSLSKKTGGGQAPAGVPLLGNDIAAWLPNEFVTDTNEFDSDLVNKDNLQFEDDKFIEVEFLAEAEENVLLNETPPQKKCKSVLDTDEYVSPVKAAHKKKKSISVSDETVLQIAALENECKNELHQLQMQVENKRLEVENQRLQNVKLENELIQAKINYYKEMTLRK